MKHDCLNEISKYFKPVDYVEDINPDDIEKQMLQDDYKRISRSLTEPLYEIYKNSCIAVKTDDNIYFVVPILLNKINGEQGYQYALAKFVDIIMRYLTGDGYINDLEPLTNAYLQLYLNISSTNELVANNKLEQAKDPNYIPPFLSVPFDFLRAQKSKNGSYLLTDDIMPTVVDWPGLANNQQESEYLIRYLPESMPMRLQYTDVHVEITSNCAYINIMYNLYFGKNVIRYINGKTPTLTISDIKDIAASPRSYPMRTIPELFISLAGGDVNMQELIQCFEDPFNYTETINKLLLTPEFEKTIHNNLILTNNIISNVFNYLPVKSEVIINHNNKLIKTLE